MEVVGLLSSMATLHLRGGREHKAGSVCSQCPWVSVSTEMDATGSVQEDLVLQRPSDHKCNYPSHRHSQMRKQEGRK